MDISLPFPEPTSAEERAEFTAILVEFSTRVNKLLRDQPHAFPQENFAPVAAEIERFFAGQLPPPEVVTLLSWYHGRGLA
jgi:hypothetical protein